MRAHHLPHRLAAIAAGVLTAGSFAALPLSANAIPPGDRQAHSFLTVMTRNLDEGTDFGYVTQAAAGHMTFGDAVAATYAEVLASDVCGRAARIADEIAAANPDLVSIQEAAVWTGPLPANCPASGSATSIDAGAALMSRLATDGARYEVVKVQDEFSSSTISALLPAGMSFLDRDLLLARVEPQTQLSLSTPVAAHFANLLPLPLGPSLSIPITRGWISVDATVRGHTTRVIATHLESFYEAIQQAQAAELVLEGGPADTTLPVVIAGDLNTGPGSSQTLSYDFLTSSTGGGFTDTWAATRPGDPGYTDAFYSEDPLTTTEPSMRIDLVLVRGAEVQRAPKDYRTGLDLPHPSDHAGVVARVAIP